MRLNDAKKKKEKKNWPKEINAQMFSNDDAIKFISGLFPSCQLNKFSFK